MTLLNNVSVRYAMFQEFGAARKYLYKVRLRMRTRLPKLGHIEETAANHNNSPLTIQGRLIKAAHLLPRQLRFTSLQTCIQEQPIRNVSGKNCSSSSKISS